MPDLDSNLAHYDRGTYLNIEEAERKKGRRPSKESGWPNMDPALSRWPGEEALEVHREREPAS